MKGNWCTGVDVNVYVEVIVNMFILKVHAFDRFKWIMIKTFTTSFDHYHVHYIIIMFNNNIIIHVCISLENWYRCNHK